MRRITIVQGEHRAVAEPGVMLSTLLGSCVAACLHDPVARVGGMNHFLLGEPAANQRLSMPEMARYGVHAMELLINAMMALGAQRANLQAHLYGGANMVAGLAEIGTSNAAFARRFMAAEGIQVSHADLGGNRARKVEFLAHDGRSRCTLATAMPPEPIAPRISVPVAARVGELELF
ncbi:chemotaxis protein CheD [uncultured Sphingomonas sp.]|uniref:chemotaxis protein CheD n=1 Tax=uncultured Sphingomonas sp. TaxID=158754 RepID=UPI002609F53B|nr:chemotaxis protein CheD [uncultured Sphingomonas sp.]